MQSWCCTYTSIMLTEGDFFLLRSSPPVGRSGVLCSEDGFVFSLLLLESLSLMMSYCLQKRAITAAHMSSTATMMMISPVCSCLSLSSPSMVMSPTEKSSRAGLAAFTLPAEPTS